MLTKIARRNCSRPRGDLNLRRVYDLPIAYYQTVQRLLREQAERYPDWEPTLGGTRDSDQKLARKQSELASAELVICPSRFVMDSLPPEIRAAKPCIVAPFGSPELHFEKERLFDIDRCAFFLPGL